jgi:hypothetical protein
LFCRDSYLVRFFSSTGKENEQPRTACILLSILLAISLVKLFYLSMLSALHSTAKCPVGHRPRSIGCYFHGRLQFKVRR